MIDEEHVTVVRVHPYAGGYAVVNAGHDRRARAVQPIDEAFPTVIAAMRWAARHRPGYQIDVAQECENEELLYRAEVAQYAEMLNRARSWYSRNSAKLAGAAATELGDALFPERVDELARWLMPNDSTHELGE